VNPTFGVKPNQPIGKYSAGRKGKPPNRKGQVRPKKNRNGRQKKRENLCLFHHKKKPPARCVTKEENWLQSHQMFKVLFQAGAEVPKGSGLFSAEGKRKSSRGKSG